MKASTPNAAATHCSTIAPATTMSARWGSKPRQRRAPLRVRSAVSASTTPSSSALVNSNRFRVWGTEPVRGRDHRRDRLGGAGRGDRHLEAVVGGGFALEAGEHRAHVRAALGDRTWGAAARREERSGSGALPKLPRHQRLATLADEHLGTATADVAQQQTPIEHGHRLQHAEVDESRLFEPGHHLDLDARPRDALGR